MQEQLESENHSIKQNGTTMMKNDKHSREDPFMYSEVISDLNKLQSNSLTVSAAKYNNPEDLLPLFKTQLELSGLSVDKLNELNVIHVAGTKGKGSTCLFIESILLKHNFNVGFYNSPHLVKVTERIRLNGKPIEERKFCHYFRKVYDTLKLKCHDHDVRMPTYFSFLTILAFHIFTKEQVDCAIIEVGIGGQFDSTNIVEKPLACGITTLDYDHVSILGPTIEAIAQAKAGIVKPKVPVFVAQQNYPQTIDVIESKATNSMSPMYICDKLELATKDQSSFKLGIEGPAQYTNAALAYHTSSYVLKELSKKKKIDSAGINDYVYSVKNSHETRIRLPTVSVDNLKDKFKQALQESRWRGRCEIVRMLPNLCLFLDGAHTKDSMVNCRDWFNSKVASINKERDSCRGVIKVLAMNIIGSRDKQSVMSPLVEDCEFEYAFFTSNKIIRKTTKSDVGDNFDALGGIHSRNTNAKTNAQIWQQLLIDKNTQQRAVGDDDHHTLCYSCRVNVNSSINETIDRLKELALKSNDEMHYCVLVTGSLHFVGAMMEALDIEGHIQIT